MKDYHIPLLVVLPAAIGLIGVLWLVRRSYSSGDRAKKLSKFQPKEKKPRTNWTDEDKLQQTSQHVEKECITVSQRKIPENQARDRGSSDLKDTGLFVSQAASRHKSEHTLSFVTNMDEGNMDASRAITTEGEENLPQSLTKLCLNPESVIEILANSQSPCQFNYSDQSFSSDLVYKTTSAHLQMSSHRSHKQKVTETKSITVPEIKSPSLETLQVCPEDDKSDALSCDTPVNFCSFAITAKTQEMNSNNKTIYASALMDGEPHGTFKSLDQTHILSSPHETLMSSSPSPEHTQSPSPALSSSKHSLLQSNSRMEQLFQGDDDFTTSKHIQQTDSSKDIDNLSKDKSESATNISMVTTIEGKISPSSANSVSKDQVLAHTVKLCETSPANNENSTFELAQGTVSSIEGTPDSILSFVDTNCVHGDLVLNQNIISCPSNKQDMALQSTISEVIAIAVTKSLLSENEQCIDSATAVTKSLLSENEQCIDSATAVIKSLLSENEQCIDSATAVIKSLLSENEQCIDSATAVTKSLLSENDQGIDSAAAVTKSLLSENDQGIDSATAAVSSTLTGENSPAKSNSPAYDIHSEGSNDSGRGGSEHDVTYQTSDTFVHFEFNMPLELCGRFIGKHGKNINYLKTKTGVHVSLTNNPYTPDYQVCQIVGSQAEVDNALRMIRRKFPLQDHPNLTMSPLSVTQTPIPTVLQPELQLILPDVTQLSLPEGVSVDVFVSAIVDAGHVFVQQPTHRSFMSLEKLNYFLNLVYNQESDVPCVPSPVEAGTICVTEHEGFWYRAMTVTPEDENRESQVKFVDYGGYSLVPVSSLKQIRADLMSLPFQAVECLMANIAPKQDEQLFSEEAAQTLSDMTRDKLLQCQVVARTEGGVPYIHLYQICAENNSVVMINQALVKSQLVRWIELI